MEFFKNSFIKTEVNTNVSVKVNSPGIDAKALLIIPVLAATVYFVSKQVRKYLRGKQQ